MNIRVLLREETSYWCPDIVERAKKMFGVYLYTPDEVTHCCELTPSYELNFVGSIPQELPQDESERDKLDMDIMEGDGQCEPVHYIHTREIDALPEIARGSLTPGTYPLSGRDWEEMEEAIEYWRGNPDY